ncbi:conserved hypothetical protein [Renibacterium salmoninarum ATCC 33209]|uniref:Regulator of SigK n=1 Tax=Renibacterium salmoninarum (strain ATCC 33209 / DSM 20767 / JCM 11484 / NBRC 15589 / NCIMB 2235) TaxID=288705 RepID=A9WPQ9_RENSM|nr:anti-sigma factor [Renibacterium salmoninarum]ABY23017.1 conserved hypothetical protein [Renibacterium salmoninarum ATCC 33209]
MSENFAEDIYSDLAAGRVLELTELYAINAVAEEERFAIEANLEQLDSSAQAEFNNRVRQARETLASAYGTIEEEPPAGLFDRIQAQIAAAAVPTPAVASPVIDELAARREQRGAGAKRRPLRTWVLTTAAAAVIAVAGTLGVNGIIQAQDPVNQVISASDVSTLDVSVQGGGQAKVSISSSKNAAVVRMENVAAPASGTTYQLWLIPQNAAAPVSLGLMSSSTALGKPALVDGIDKGQALAITVEPSGGSKTPTTTPVMIAQLHA